MLLKEAAGKSLGVLVHAKVVGVDYSAGDDQRVEIRGIGLRHRDVDVEGLAFFGAVVTLQLSGLGRHQRGLAAGFLHGIPRAGELHLFHAVGQQERNLLACNIVR
ncbi:hypothetical protein D9M69_633140 [compost metagenome]